MTVREDGVLRIRGRNLGAVTTVVFLGASLRGDEAPVTVTPANTRALDVRVALVANSGRVVLVDDAGNRSQPSPAA